MKSVAAQITLPQFSRHRIGGFAGLVALVAILPVLIGLLANISGLAAGPANPFDVIDFAESRRVGGQEARALIAAGALVLDARAPERRLADPLANVQPIDGIDLSSSDLMLTAGLRAYGVSAAQPVVVVGDPADGDSRDGTIVEALRSLGHPRVVLVEGGLPALRDAGFVSIYPPSGGGDFTVARQND
ncbi:MAG: hypothetical protein JNL25_11890 [Rhodospirillaceae bacterium]|nr:hypothetical protein [Rhodospirillaceae bacterium]